MMRRDLCKECNHVCVLLCSPDLIRRASIEKGEGVWGSQGFAAAKCLSLFWLAFGGSFRLLPPPSARWGGGICRQVREGQGK